MKKIAVAAVALLLGASVFADVSFEFYNKAYSDTLIINKNDDDNIPLPDYDDGMDMKFSGVYNKVYAQVRTARVDAMIKAIAFIGSDKEHGAFDDNNGIHWNGMIDDWYIEFRPFASITLGFHDSIYMQGSYLPIYDDNLYSGNIGSEGVTVVYRPPVLDGALRLSATVPFTADNTNWYWVDDDSSYDDTFNFGLGAIFTHKYFEAGVTIQDILDGDERTIGTYAYLPGLFGLVKNLNVGAGFAYSEKTVSNFDDKTTFGDYTVYGGVAGDRLLSTFLTYDTGKFDVAAELVWNLGDTTGSNGERSLSQRSLGDAAGPNGELYTAVQVAFGLMDKVTATVVGKLVTDVADDNVYAAEFKLDYQFNKHNEFEIGAAADLWDGNFNVRFPVYWKYTF